MVAAHLDLELESIALAGVVMPGVLLEATRLVVESISNAAFAVHLDTPDENLLFLAADNPRKSGANRPTVRVPQIVWSPLAVYTSLKADRLLIGQPGDIVNIAAIECNLRKLTLVWLHSLAHNTLSCSLLLLIHLHVHVHVLGVSHICQVGQKYTHYYNFNFTNKKFCLYWYFVCCLSFCLFSRIRIPAAPPLAQSYRATSYTCIPPVHPL